MASVLGTALLVVGRAVKTASGALWPRRWPGGRDDAGGAFVRALVGGPRVGCGGVHGAVRRRVAANLAMVASAGRSLDVPQACGVSLDEVARGQEAGAKVICGVNSMVLARPELADLPGMGASHAVEVIGVRRRPGETWVVLNDPGVEGGRGMHVRASTFLRAWGTGGNYAVIARRGGCAI